MFSPQTGSVSPICRPISGLKCAGRKRDAAATRAAAVLAVATSPKISRASLPKSSGLFDMDSTPPATIASASPAAIR